MMTLNRKGCYSRNLKKGTASKSLNILPQKQYPSLWSCAKIIVTFWINTPLQGNFQQAETYQIQTQYQNLRHEYGYLLQFDVSKQPTNIKHNSVFSTPLSLL